jgi:hypothetical protein
MRIIFLSLYVYIYLYIERERGLRERERERRESWGGSERHCNGGGSRGNTILGLEDSQAVPATSSARGKACDQK